MGRKIFVSYKYEDDSVQGYDTTARNYVDELEKIIEVEDHICKAEPDDNDLSQLSDEAIRKILSDRIFDSTVTIVMISPQMQEYGRPERYQWIPWEILYSLRIEQRKHGKSYANAVLAVVLPDIHNSYEYYIKENICLHCNARTLRVDKLFPILQKNMFNAKNPKFSDCPYHESRTVYTGDSSYILSVKWSDFRNNPNYYITNAITINENIDDYEIHKQLEQP